MQLNSTSSRLLLIRISAIAILLLIIGSLTNCQKTPVRQTTGMALFVIGEVTIASPGQPGRQLAVKEIIRPGDRLHTAQNAEATIQINGEAVVRLFPATDITFTAILDKKEGTALRLDQGKAYSMVLKKKDPHYAMHTPTMVAAVRGTEFTTASSGKGSSVALGRGRVLLTSKRAGSEEMLLEENHQAKLGMTGTLTAAPLTREQGVEMEKNRLYRYIENAEGTSPEELEKIYKDIKEQETALDKEHANAAIPASPVRKKTTGMTAGVVAQERIKKPLENRKGNVVIARPGVTTAVSPQGEKSGGDGLRTIRYADGSRYTGSMLNNQRHGFGTFTWYNGDVYEGNWQFGSMAGEGIYSWKSGDRYVGEWLNGKMDGRGTYSWPDSVNVSGIFQNGQFVKGASR